MLASLLLALASSIGVTAPPIDTIYIPLPDMPQQRLALHCARPAQSAQKSVLFIHGASFPTMLASGFAFAPGDSWIQYMARKGYLACGLDFLGFGDSSRPAAMNGPANAAAPVTDAKQAAREIALAVDALRQQPGITRVHLIAHSWGTVPAAVFAAAHPHALASLTLFGPIVPVPGTKPAARTAPAWWTITAQARLEQLRFENLLPVGTHWLEPAVEQRWASAFAASVPPMQGDPAGALRIPYGPLADIDAVATGTYPYDASAVVAPVFVVYGSDDDVVDDAGAAPFLARFTHSPLRWRLRIDNATHVMHLERNRHSLYASVDAFIRTVDDQLP